MFKNFTIAWRYFRKSRHEGSSPRFLVLQIIKKYCKILSGHMDIPETEMV